MTERIINIYDDGSKCLAYELLGLALDHHSMCVVCQGWSNPYTYAARMEFQELVEWRLPAR